MPQKDTLLQTMTDEVTPLILDKGLSFKAAFAKVAHQHNIWHHKEREQYNYFFRQVMANVKKKIGRAVLSQACTKRIPPIASAGFKNRTDFKKLAAHDID